MSKNLNKEQISVKTLQTELNTTKNVHGFSEELKAKYRLLCNTRFNTISLKLPERNNKLKNAKNFIKSYNTRLLSQNKQNYILQMASTSEINENSSLNIVINQVEKLSNLEIKPLKKPKHT